MMETAVNNSMCRCCASEGAFKDVKSTYHWMGEEEIYADMLRDCFDINLNLSEHCDDGGICEVCITQLRNAINFKKQVLHTEEQFKKHVQNKTLFRPNIVKVEVQGEDDSDDNASGDDGFSGPEYDVPIKTEDSDDPKPKKRSAKATPTRAKKAKTDNGETSTKRDGKGSKPKATIKKETVKRANTHTKAKQKLREEFNKHQSNIKEILMCTNATPIRRQKDADFVCCFCNAQFRDPADLKTHSLDIHKDQHNPVALQILKNRKTEFCIKLDITDLQCKLCSSKIDSLDKLFEHLNTVHNRTIYTDIKNQILPFKFDGEDIKCCICSSVFEKFRKLQEHMHTHYRNYICEVCELGFVTRGSLMSHSEKHKLGTFKCNSCTKVFDTLRKKRSHEKSVHIHLYLVSKCGYCNERFTTNQKKDDHLAKVHGVIFHTIKCRACDKVFENKRSLTTHTKRDHLMERKYICSLCEMRFFASNELKMHMVKHTGVKEFTCDVCLKSYARKKTLTQHMRIHMDDRRFKCEHCGQAFVQKCSWKGHMRSRHGKIV